MAELNWTSEAERWLHDIYQFIAKDNPQAAAEVVNGIFEKAQHLVEYPEIGYRYEGTESDVRILLYGHYRIAYVVRTNQVADIVGVFHGALDIDRYLV